MRSGRSADTHRNRGNALFHRTKNSCPRSAIRALSASRILLKACLYRPHTIACSSCAIAAALLLVLAIVLLAVMAAARRLVAFGPLAGL